MAYLFGVLRRTLSQEGKLLLKKSRYTEAKIVKILKEVCREYGISEPTYYNRKSKYGGMEASEIKRLEDLEDENRRHKALFADLNFVNPCV